MRASIQNNSILNDSVGSLKRSPDKENNIKIAKPEGEKLSLYPHEIPTTLRPCNETDSDIRSFKIDLTKMRKQWDKKMPKKHVRQPEKKTFVTAVQSNFETFNHTPQNKNNREDIAITKEEHELIQNDSSSDTDEFENDYSAKIDLSNTSNYLSNTWFNIKNGIDRKPSIKNKNRKYINEFGEESVLSESSAEEIKNKPLSRSHYQNTAKPKQHIVQNAYIPQKKYQSLFNKQISAFNNRQIGMKNRTKENVNPKHIHSTETRGCNVSDSLVESMFVPKIKLNTINCKLVDFNCYSSDELFNDK
jgi:hypothetical protein